jgi:hypothetical protein
MHHTGDEVTDLSFRIGEFLSHGNYDTGEIKPVDRVRGTHSICQLPVYQRNIEDISKMFIFDLSISAYR